MLHVNIFSETESFFFLDICSYPRTHYVDQAILERTEIYLPLPPKWSARIKDVSPTPIPATKFS